MSAAFKSISRTRKLESPRNAILSLSLGAFAIGASEFMISGLLRDVAADLGVTIPTAGLLITGYALGVAVGGPLMAILTGRLGRKEQLLLLIGIFITGNMLCATAPSYFVLLVGRMVGAFCHGAYHGTASVVAGTLVPAEQRVRAIALISAGVMIANVVGVPCGTALGQAVGWRAAFWAVSVLGATAAAALMLCLPAEIGVAPMKLRSEFKALARPKVLLGFLLSFLFCLGLFGLFTYMTPLLTTVSGAKPEQIPTLLLLFGLGATVGVIGGGRLADRGLTLSIAIAFAAQIAVYTMIVCFSSSLAAMYFLLFMLGAVAMAAVAPLKTLVLSAAFDAPGMASALTSSTLNLGVAIGAAIGALLLHNGLGYSDLPFIGIASASMGLLILWLRGRS